MGQSTLLVRDRRKSVLQSRLGGNASIETVNYGEVKTMNAIALSLHPAGHILGSAQVRIERNGQVVVVSGDYKTAPDPTCAPLEPIRCHAFITESTFGLPIFRWPCHEESTFQTSIHGGARNQEEAAPAFSSHMPWARRSGLSPVWMQPSDRF